MPFSPAALLPKQLDWNHRSDVLLQKVAPRDSIALGDYPTRLRVSSGNAVASVRNTGMNGTTTRVSAGLRVNMVASGEAGRQESSQNGGDEVRPKIGDFLNRLPQRIDDGAQSACFRNSPPTSESRCRKQTHAQVEGHSLRRGQHQVASEVRSGRLALVPQENKSHRGQK